MERAKIDRINELARKSKETPLSEEEKAEQAALRAEYLAEFRRDMQRTRDNTYLQRPDGTKEKIQRKKQ